MKLPLHKKPCLQMSQANTSSPMIIWGGLMPSGSLKYLTLANYLKILTLKQIGKGFIEMSEGCTALTLEYFAQLLNVELTIVCTDNGEKSLHAHGYKGRTIKVENLKDAFDICETKEKDGWHWLRQMTNQNLIDAVIEWAQDIVQFLKKFPEINTVVCGFGTGATVTGLSKVLSPLGYTVIALESPCGQSIRGWRHYSDQNLGDQDLFYPYRHDIKKLTANTQKNQYVTPLNVLLSHNYGIDPKHVCIVSHDGVP